jgi:hypothetical protein
MYNIRETADCASPRILYPAAAPQYKGFVILMKIVNRTLFVLLILSIPLVCILTALNISARVPDLYRYDFNRSQVVKDIGLDVSNDDLADFFSEYMFGTLKDFQYTAYYTGRERPIFGMGEGVIMDQIRSLLNLSVKLLCTMAALILFACWFLLRQGRKEAVRYAYYAGVGLYVLIVAGMIAAAWESSLLVKLFGEFFLYHFDESDLVPQILTPAIFMENAVVAAFISFIMLIAGFSIIKRLTRPDRMFY